MYHGRPHTTYIVSCQRHSPELHLLIRRQNQIGWRQLFNGRFSEEWSRIQSDYYYRTRDERPGLIHKFTGNGWQVKIITAMWKNWRTLWLQRNQDVFGHDSATSLSAETKEVKRRLVQIYDQRSLMEPSAQSLLCADIEAHSQQPTWVVKNWLLINAPVLQASILRARTNATRGVRSIRSYFGTGSLQAPDPE
jgi:hypothetical protein